MTELSKEPGLRRLPVPHHGFRRDIQHICGLFDREAELLGASEEVIAAWRRVHAEIKQADVTGGLREAVQCILTHVPGESQRGSAALRLSVLHAEAGNLDAAFEHLDRAIASRDPSLVHLAVAPQWDNLRPDPRYDQCLRRMRLPHVSNARAIAPDLEPDPKLHPP